MTTVINFTNVKEVKANLYFIKVDGVVYDRAMYAENIAVKYASLGEMLAAARNNKTSGVTQSFLASCERKEEVRKVESELRRACVSTHHTPRYLGHTTTVVTYGKTTTKFGDVVEFIPESPSWGYITVNGR